MNSESNDLSPGSPSLFLLFFLLIFLTVQPTLALDRKLKCLGITFHVVCANGLLSIIPAGLANNSPLQVAVSSEVTKAVSLDLDHNGTPELFLFLREKGISARGHVLAFGTNGGRALDFIKIPALTPEQQLGYLGHDEFTFMEGCFMRRFSVPNQKVREIQYRLRLQPAGYVLTPIRTVEF